MARIFVGSAGDWAERTAESRLTGGLDPIAIAESRNDRQEKRSADHGEPPKRFGQWIVNLDRFCAVRAERNARFLAASFPSGSSNLTWTVKSSNG